MTARLGHTMILFLLTIENVHQHAGWKAQLHWYRGILIAAPQKGHILMKYSLLFAGLPKEH